MRCGRRSSGAARRTRRCPQDAPLDFRPGAVGCEACGLVCVPAEHDGTVPALRLGACTRASPTASCRTWAFVIAAAILYIPANVYPVLTVIQLGAGAPSTILGGVEELLASRMYPLALLVFFASILVPMFKLLGLGAMLLATKLGGHRAGRRPCCCASGRGSTTSSPGSAAGRWSTFSWNRCWARWSSSAERSPSSPASAPSPSAPWSFITIFAAEAFDPRLMWDAAARNAHHPLPSGRAYPGTAAAAPQLRAKAKPSLIVWYSLRPAVGSTVVNWYPADSLAPRPISRIEPAVEFVPVETGAAARAVGLEVEVEFVRHQDGPRQIADRVLGAQPVARAEQKRAAGVEEQLLHAHAVGQREMAEIHAVGDVLEGSAQRRDLCRIGLVLDVAPDNGPSSA